MLLIFVMVTSLLSAQTEIKKSLEDFTKVKVFNGLDVDLIKSDENKIEVTGELTDKVKIKNSGSTLKLSLKFPETTANGKVSIKLYFKELILIDANEGATVTGKDFDQLHLDVRVQEGAFMNLVTKTKHLKVKSSSGGVLKLSGSTKNQTVDVDLGGTYHGYKMEVSDMCIVKAGSGAKAEVQAGETLDAKVTFGGSIFYRGEPEVLKDKKVLGGTIRQKN